MPGTTSSCKCRFPDAFVNNDKKKFDFRGPHVPGHRYQQKSVGPTPQNFDAQ